MTIFPRKVIRLSLFFAWSLPISLLGWCCTRGKFASRGRNWTRFWACGVLRIIGMHVRVAGGKVSDFSGGLIVANHQSYLDILVQASLFLIRFTPKIEMKSWPLLGFMTGVNHPIWVDRTSRCRAGKTAAEMARAMREGSALAVYPEGTTSEAENGLLPFKSTPFEAAAASGAPILPMLIFYHPEPAARIAWTGDESLLPSIWRILGLKRIGVTVYIMPEMHSRTGEDRKALALRVHDEMNREYGRSMEHGI